MKALASVVLVVAVCLSAAMPLNAADDKQLLNHKGQVYQQGPQPNATQNPVALNATVSIGDNDFAGAGPDSQGWINLPDSTRILIGQNNLTTAKFVLVNNGKMRFVVQHPGGAKANYTFSTTAGQIAVRGTEGDVGVTDAQFQVNVYQITDPSVPVEVTLNDGKKFELHAGQTLTVALGAAAVAAGAAGSAGSSGSGGTAGSSGSVSSTTQAQTNQFSEFGSPEETLAAAAALGAAISGIPAVAAIAAGAVALGGVIVGTGGHGGGSQPTPQPGIQLNPSSLSFTNGSGPLTLTASESGFSGTFSAASGNTGVVTVASQSSDIFTVTAVGNGSTSISVTDGQGHNASVPATVQSTIAGPAALAFTSINQVLPMNVSEPYYGGTFKASSANKAVAKVTAPASSSSSSGNFQVTALSNGQTTINVTDTLGHTLAVPVTVNAVSASPTPTTIPICIGALLAAREAHGMRPDAPRPQPTATCPPTPMAAPVMLKPVPRPVAKPIGPQPPPMIGPPRIGPPGLPGQPTPPPMPGGPPNE
jgi:hypothetical protein